MTTTEYLVTVERDEDGYWVADFVEVPGCYTQARTVSSLLTRARDALASFVGDTEADGAVLVIQLLGVSARTRHALAGYATTREAASRDQARSLRGLAEASRDLRDQGFTLRDIAAIAGVSHGRIAQLLDQLDAEGFPEPTPFDRVRIAS